MTRTGIPLALVVLALVTGRPTVAQEPETPPSAAELEQQFEDTMMGARLIGHFTVTGAGSENLPRPDSYTVSRISKLEDGRWLFEASMSYGDNAVAIPMPFDVVWAGDTPVITLTDQTIPGLGTFSARVLIYEGEYAGTWKHGAFGGHMWGRIETGDEATEPPQTDPAP
jgi:hypothetical protein